MDFGLSSGMLDAEDVWVDDTLHHRSLGISEDIYIDLASCRQHQKMRRCSSYERIVINNEFTAGSRHPLLRQDNKLPWQRTTFACKADYLLTYHDHSLRSAWLKIMISGTSNHAISCPTLGELSSSNRQQTSAKGTENRRSLDNVHRGFQIGCK